MIKLCSTNGLELRNKAKAFWQASHKEDGLPLFINDEFNPTAILSCIYGATKDLTPRTFGSINDESEKEQREKELSKEWNLVVNDPTITSFKEHHNKIFFQISAIIFSEFYTTINNLLKDYLKSNGLPIKKFDDEHHELCKLVQKKLSIRYPSPEYGKAQKICNMTFKHMYCLLATEADSTINKYEAFFEHCHMPLDSYIIAWFKREHLKVSEQPLIGVNYTEIGYKTKYNGLVADKVSAWSHIDCVDKNGKYPYEFYRDRIRELIKTDKYNEMSALQTEIVWWKLIQNEQAAEAFLFALLDDTWEGAEKGKIDNDKNIIRYMDYEKKKAMILAVLN